VTLAFRLPVLHIAGRWPEWRTSLGQPPAVVSESAPRTELKVGLRTTLKR